MTDLDLVLVSQGQTMFLSLVFDKSSMIQCNETITLFNIVKSKVEYCFTTTLLLIFAVLLSSFFGGQSRSISSSSTPSGLCQCPPVVLEVAASDVPHHLVIPPHLLTSC